MPFGQQQNLEVFTAQFLMLYVPHQIVLASRFVSSKAQVVGVDGGYENERSRGVVRDLSIKGLKRGYG